MKIKAFAKHLTPPLLALGAVIGFVLWSQYIGGTTVGEWLGMNLYWNYAAQAFFFALPLTILAVRFRQPSEYGLVVGTLSRQDLRRLAIVASALIALPIAAEIILGRPVLNNTFVLFPISTLVFQLVFSSFGEELFFRGLCQGELNRTFGRPWRIGATRFGPSVLIIAIMFGLGHAANPTDLLLRPWTLFDPQYTIHWGAFWFTGGFALVAGLLRERTGGIFAPAVIHWAVDFFVHMFDLGEAGKIGLFYGFVIAIGVVCVWLFKPDSGGHGTESSSVAQPPTTDRET